MIGGGLSLVDNRRPFVRVDVSLEITYSAEIERSDEKMAKYVGTANWTITILSLQIIADPDSHYFNMGNLLRWREG